MRQAAADEAPGEYIVPCATQRERASPIRVRDAQAVTQRTIKGSWVLYARWTLLGIRTHVCMCICGYVLEVCVCKVRAMGAMGSTYGESMLFIHT